MAAYLCIASNGVPPTVSKRISLSVECESQFHSLSFLFGVAIHFVCIDLLIIIKVVVGWLLLLL
jgi:hypothetical protein